VVTDELPDQLGFELLRSSFDSNPQTVDIGAQ
jgi:hypothetical protein